MSAPETDWNKPFSACYQCGLNNTRAVVVVAMLYSPSPRGSNVWIISWKMVFLMVLLCKEAELPPRWRDGFSWAKRWLKSWRLLTVTPKLPLCWHQQGCRVNTPPVTGIMLLVLLCVSFLADWFIWGFIPLTESCPVEQEVCCLRCSQFPVGSHVFSVIIFHR